jgi:hypothetical protein
MHIFDRDTNLTETAPSVFTGAISENWLINKNPNGGYLMAILARAMTDKSEKKSTPIITANYISRCRPGGIEVRVEEISVSKQFSRYEARLFQNGAEKIRAFGTFADDNTDCAINRNEEAPASGCRRFRDTRSSTTSICCSIRNARDGFRENASTPPRTGGGSGSGKGGATISFPCFRS